MPYPEIDSKKSGNIHAKSQVRPETIAYVAPRAELCGDCELSFEPNGIYGMSEGPFQALDQQGLLL